MIEATTINAGEATRNTSTNQPAILTKEQQSDANQEPKSKKSLLFYLIGHVNGVSVHYLRTILLLQEVRDAGGLDEDTVTIYDMDTQHTCPRDGKLGATYVDSIQGEDFVRDANVLLSYMAYCATISRTLSRRLNINARLTSVIPSGHMSGYIAYATTSTVLVVKMFPLSNSVIFSSQLLLASGLLWEDDDSTLFHL